MNGIDHHRNGGAVTVTPTSAPPRTRDVVRDATDALAVSLDAATDDEPIRLDHRAAIGISDPGYDQVDARLAVSGYLHRLSERERLLLQLRFVDRLTQAEIGRSLGVSQMQVSRWLTALLHRIRSWHTNED